MIVGPQPAVDQESEVGPPCRWVLPLHDRPSAAARTSAADTVADPDAATPGATTAGRSADTRSPADLVRAQIS